MSAFIGDVRGPNHNSPNVAAEVWCSLGGVELTLIEGSPAHSIRRNFDPIAARNLAALLVRASEEVQRMRDRASTESGESDP